MRKRRYQKRFDLSNVDGTVTSVFTTNYSILKDCFEDDDISSIEFKELILDLYDENVYMTDKAKKIRAKIVTINTKYNLIDYITQIILKGSDLGVINDFE